MMAAFTAHLFASMFIKIVIILLLIAVLVSLMSSMVFLVRDGSERRRTLTGLKIRVALSVTLFALLILSYYMGWIQPHGVVP